MHWSAEEINSVSPIIHLSKEVCMTCTKSIIMVKLVCVIETIDDKHLLYPPEFEFLYEDGRVLHWALQNTGSLVIKLI